MTISIVIKGPDSITGGTASAYPGVGLWAQHGIADSGLVITQGNADREGYRLAQELKHRPASQVMRERSRVDSENDTRQTILVPLNGEFEIHSGSRCVPYAEIETRTMGDTVVIAAVNMMEEPGTATKMLDAAENALQNQRTPGTALLSGLQAGANDDIRGPITSAALIATSSHTWQWRVDCEDIQNPLELLRETTGTLITSNNRKSDHPQLLAVLAACKQIGAFTKTGSYDAAHAHVKELDTKLIGPRFLEYVKYFDAIAYATAGDMAGAHRVLGEISSRWSTLFQRDFGGGRELSSRPNSDLERTLAYPSLDVVRDQ